MTKSRLAGDNLVKYGNFRTRGSRLHRLTSSLLTSIIPRLSVPASGIRSLGSMLSSLLLAGLLLVSLLCAIINNAWALDLETVLANTAVTPPARVQFSEQRHNPMLKEPLQLTGYLEYVKPGHLGKVVETPFNEAFVVDDGRIEIKQNGQSRRLSLNKSKPLKAMLEGIEAVLAGHATELAEIFDYELNGSEADWTLRLVPKSSRVAKHLSAMTVKGSDVATTSIRTDQGENEWSQMDIQAVSSLP